jgi:hypothetical protein
MGGQAMGTTLVPAAKSTIEIGLHRDFNLTLWSIICEQPFAQYVSADKAGKETLLDNRTCHYSNDVKAWQITPWKRNGGRVRWIATGHAAYGRDPVPIRL